MQSKASTPEEYVSRIPAEQRDAFINLRELILEHLPDGFVEEMSYGMIGYVVPHLLYPAGYHCDPKLPLPFMNLAAQKNYIALYHMGIYADPELLDWFTAEYPKYCKTKPDMGKSCIRFKKYTEIPFELIAQLVGKISVRQWIERYEQQIKVSK